MLPGYGCDLWRMVFQELTPTLMTEIKDLVDFLHAKRKTPKTAATATQSR